MNGNGDFNPDTWHGVMDLWQYWYKNGLRNEMTEDDAIQFATDQTMWKASHACRLFADAVKNK